VQAGALDAYRDRGDVGWIGGEASIGECGDEIVAELPDANDRESGGNYQVAFVICGSLLA